MRVAFFGDIVGKTGRQKLESSLHQFISSEKIDFVVVNAENATSGAGLSANHAEDLLNASVDCITLGDHAYDNKEIIPLLAHTKQIVRPINYSDDCPGQGWQFFQPQSRIYQLPIVGFWPCHLSHLSDKQQIYQSRYNGWPETLCYASLHPARHSISPE